MKKSTFLPIIFYAAFLLCLAGTVEIAVRILFPAINFQGHSKDLFKANIFNGSYGLSPNFKGLSFGARVITDEVGFRIDPSLPLGNAKHTILFLGDSVCFGSGVSAQDTYPFLLQRMLKECNIVNAAAPGYCSSDYSKVLKSLSQKLDFESVVVNLCLNDFSDISQSLIGSELNKQEIDKALDADIKKRFPNPVMCFANRLSKYLKFNVFLISHSKAYRLLKNLLTDTSKNYFLADVVQYDDSETANLISGELAVLNGLAVKNNKHIIFFVFPYEFQLRSQSIGDVAKPQKMLKKIASENNILLIDLYPALKDYMQKNKISSRTLFLYGDPMHLSCVGHKIVAQSMFDELKKMLFNHRKRIVN